MNNITYIIYTISKKQKTIFISQRTQSSNTWDTSRYVENTQVTFPVNTHPDIIRLLVKYPLHTISDWWYTYPSEKYKSQLG